MDMEVHGLVDCGTWEFIPWSIDANCDRQMLFMLKHNPDGSIAQLKTFCGCLWLLSKLMTLIIGKVSLLWPCLTRYGFFSLFQFIILISSALVYI